MKHLNLLFIGLLITILSSCTSERSKIDKFFDAIEENDKGMGSVSVFKDGKEMYHRSYGYADIANNQKANAETKYRIGSISKTFTATAVMKLIEESKLSLSTPLSEYYPQITNADKITIKHLLQHRSGIFNFTNDDLMSWNTQPHSKEQLLNRIIAGGINFEPNAQFEYSNSNYALLAFIMEDIVGKNYPELINEMIIKPCGLKNTYVGNKQASAENIAFSYGRLFDWQYIQETDESILIGAGSILSTPTDLNVFLYCLFNETLVSKESLELMTTLKDNFGFGLFRVPFYEQKGYGHTGGIDGFQANAYYFPGDNVSVAVCSNGVVYPLNDIVIALLSDCYDMEFQIPDFNETITLSEDQLDKYTGVYSGPEMPLKITIAKDGNALTGQGTGQSAFPLEYIGDNKFQFEAARIETEFFPDENKMIFTQSGVRFDLTKEE